MTMWARIKPDRVGRPTTLHFSSHAARIIGSHAFTLTPTSDALTLEVSVTDGEYRIGKARTVSAGRVLDTLNTKRQLHGEPFPIRRDGQAFTLEVYNPDAHLPSTSSRLTALPMAFTAPRKLQKQSLTLEEFVKVFALAEVALQTPITEDSLRSERSGILAALPEISSIQGRFGGFTRLRQFMDYQVSAAHARGVTVENAKTQLAALLETTREE